MSMKNQDHEELYSSKKQSCRATAATRKTHMHPSWNRVWGSTSQGFDLNAIKFRTTTYIEIDYSTRQTRERVRCHRGSARVNGRGAAGRDAYPSLVRVARVLTSISWCICARVPETNVYDRALAHTRRLRNRALGSPHVALPDSCIVQGCALRVVHVLHPFDPPRHKSSSAHCASSARHVLRRTAPTRTRLGGGHGVRISTPDLGPRVTWAQTDGRNTAFLGLLKPRLHRGFSADLDTPWPRQKDAWYQKLLRRSSQDLTMQ
ncbi:hypothetical protein B0H14DRAFT_2609676 [Mycena olivaceomarginata]|nr:hypothetical protein B0H14DRAFT_2609676 [Mycena olivaceomarginata]